MATVTYLSGGEQPLAAQMNALFEEFDRRMALLLSDRTFLLLPPARRAPLHRLLGQCFYFLSTTNPNFRSHGLPGWTGDSYAWAAVTYPRDKRHALAELVIENPDTPVALPSGWDYYDTFRIHNLGRVPVVVQLASGVPLTVPAWSCRTVRRTAGGTWLTGWKYFQKFTAGDPRTWYYNASPGFANNVLNPTVLLDWVAAFEGRQWTVAPVLSGSGLSAAELLGLLGGGWQPGGLAGSGGSEAGRFLGARWQADPARLVPDLGNYDASYTALTDGAAIEDAVRHRGTVRVLDAAGAVVGEYEHTGIAGLVGGLAALGVTVTRNGSGDLVFTAADRNLHAVSSNVLGYREVSTSLRPTLLTGNALVVGPGFPAMPLTADMRITRVGVPHLLTAVVGIDHVYQTPFPPAAPLTIPAVGFNTTSGRVTTLPGVRANGQTLADLKALNWLWSETSPDWSGTNQDTPWATHSNRRWLRTPAGQVLTTDVEIPAALLSPGWLPEQRVFAGRRSGDAWPLVRVGTAGVTVRAFAAFIDGTWPELDASSARPAGSRALWLSPREQRMYGVKGPRGAAFVEKPTTAGFSLLPVSIRRAETRVAQLVDPAGTGFGWWQPPDPRDAAAVRPPGVPADDEVLVGPLLHEHYNLLAWRVNSLAVYDPLDLQDLAWPLVEGVYTPHLTAGMSIAWTGIQPNYFAGGPVDHYAGWLAADELRPEMGAEIWRAVEADTGESIEARTAADNPAAVERYDRRMWHYTATVSWTGNQRYRTGSSGPYRYEYLGSVGMSASRGTLSAWLNNWNAAGNPYFSLAHRQHRWVSGDQLAALAASCGVAFRHAQFGVRFAFREDAQVPDVSSLVVLNGQASVNTTWSDEFNSSADNVPNSALEGLVRVGGQGVPATDGNMMFKTLPWGYPNAQWLINSRTAGQQPLISLAIPEAVSGASHPALRLNDFRTVSGLWTGQVGGGGSSIDDGRGLSDAAVLMGPFSDPAMYTVTRAKENFSVVAWGTGWETLRTRVPLEVDFVLQPDAGSERFEGTFSEEQWGALYQVFFQGIEY